MSLKPDPFNRTIPARTWHREHADVKLEFLRRLVVGSKWLHQVCAGRSAALSPPIQRRVEMTVVVQQLHRHDEFVGGERVSYSASLHEPKRSLVVADNGISLGHQVFDVIVIEVFQFKLPIPPDELRRQEPPPRVRRTASVGKNRRVRNLDSEARPHSNLNSDASFGEGINVDLLMKAPDFW